MSVAVAPSVLANPFGFHIEALHDQPFTGSQSFNNEFSEFFKLLKAKQWASPDSIKYWFVHQKKFPKIFELALAILNIPASGASVERMFSQLTIHSDYHKNRSKAELLRRRVLLSSSKSIYENVVNKS
jgi:hypothetical protein